MREQAYVPAPVCAPSRSCLASARDYDDQVAHAGVPTNQHDYNISTPTFYKQLREAGYYTMVTGKDDLTKASGLGYYFGMSCGKPPCGCPECIDGSSRYHQSELGFVDGLRSAGKIGVLANYGQPRGQPFDMYGKMLLNHTVKLENGSTVNAWEMHIACMLGNPSLGLDPEAPLPTDGVHPLCDRTSDSQQLYEDDWVASNAIRLLESWSKQGKVNDGAPPPPFFMQVNFPGERKTARPVCQSESKRYMMYTGRFLCHGPTVDSKCYAWYMIV